MSEGTVDTTKPLGSDLSPKEQFDNYKAEGGIFDEGLFRTIQGNANKFDVKFLNTPTLAQVRGLSETAEIEDSPQTTAIYGMLRTGELELSPTQMEDKSIQEQLEKINSSSDQVVFAEALLLTGRAREYVKFISKYPNIFKNQATGSVVENTPASSPVLEKTS